ncbi:MAG: hypothetical protein K2U26_08655 [Cyclobacteriaceae bacterium]|nr:hypothetical protein [Cyclobacteriaceae bacterium]
MKLNLGIQGVVQSLKNSTKDVNLNVEVAKVIDDSINDAKRNTQLSQADLELFLITAEFQKSAIPDIINFATEGENSSNLGGRTQGFWDIVGVILVVAVSVAVIGAVVGAAVAYAIGSTAAAITAASFTGLWLGASVGAVWGAVESIGFNRCPADCWWQSCFPLVDWDSNCF